jgi:hypothetical protein
MSRRLDDKRRIEYVEHFLLKLKPVLILVFMTGIDRSNSNSLFRSVSISCFSPWYLDPSIVTQT